MSPAKTKFASKRPSTKKMPTAKPYLRSEDEVVAYLEDIRNDVTNMTCEEDVANAMHDDASLEDIRRHNIVAQKAFGADNPNIKYLWSEYFRLSNQYDYEVGVLMAPIAEWRRKRGKI